MDPMFPRKPGPTAETEFGRLSLAFDRNFDPPAMTDEQLRDAGYQASSLMNMARLTDSEENMGFARECFRAVRGEQNRRALKLVER